MQPDLPAPCLSIGPQIPTPATSGHPLMPKFSGPGPIVKSAIFSFAFCILHSPLRMISPEMRG